MAVRMMFSRCQFAVYCGLAYQRVSTSNAIWSEGKVAIASDNDRESVVNRSDRFQCGEIWPPVPSGSIPPLSSIALFVCNKDFATFIGVSRGIGLRVYENDSCELFTSEGKDWWICTFSSPNGSSNQCLTKWKDHGIHPLWEEMHMAHHVNGPLCGCYQKDVNHMVFTWKGPASNRSSPRSSFFSERSASGCIKSIQRWISKLIANIGDWLMEIATLEWKLAGNLYNDFLSIKSTLEAYISELLDGCERFIVWLMS